MRKELNCPNCGAPITDTQCAYCGTVFYDFSTMAVGEAQAVKFRHGDQHLIFNAIVTNYEVTMKSDADYFYADSVRYYVQRPNNFEINLTLEAIPDDKGVFLTKRKMNYE